jgi:hypothetical protein
VEEKRKINRKGEVFPLAIRHTESGKMPDIPWDQFESAADDILEPKGARIARTQHPTIGYFQQVSMTGRENCATNLASLSGSSRLTKTAQSLYEILLPLIAHFRDNKTGEPESQLDCLKEPSPTTRAFLNR